LHVALTIKEHFSFAVNEEIVFVISAASLFAKVKMFEAPPPQIEED
jgi:hypothetical protein